MYIGVYVFIYFDMSYVSIKQYYVAKRLKLYFICHNREINKLGNNTTGNQQ